MPGTWRSNMAALTPRTHARLDTPPARGDDAWGVRLPSESDEAWWAAPIRERTFTRWFKNGHWRKMPLELHALVAFAIIVSLAHMTLLLFARSTFETLIQYTGWTAAFPLASAGVGALRVGMSRTRKSRNWLVVYLIAFAIGQLIEFFVMRQHSDVYVMRHGSDFDNPYLRISPYRPIWQTALPLLWACVLLSPRVTRYCDRVRAGTVRMHRDAFA